MIYFFVQNITPEKEESDGNAIYQAERHGESLLTILKEKPACSAVHSDHQRVHSTLPDV